MAELALTGGALEKSKWGAGGIAKVSFKAKWVWTGHTHTFTHTHIHTWTTLLSLSIRRESFMYQTRNLSSVCTETNMLPHFHI